MKKRVHLLKEMAFFLAKLNVGMPYGGAASGRPYWVQPNVSTPDSWEEPKARPAGRGLPGDADILPSKAAITRGQLANMLPPLTNPEQFGPVPSAHA